MKPSNASTSSNAKPPHTSSLAAIRCTVWPTGRTLEVNVMAGGAPRTCCDPDGRPDARMRHQVGEVQLYCPTHLPQHGMGKDPASSYREAQGALTEP